MSKNLKKSFFLWCLPFDHRTSRCYQMKDILRNGKKKKFWAALSDIFSRLHAAVTVYFGAPAWPDTVSDRDWCKINTSQECDVLINSLCCSDRGARHVRGGLQRRPLWSCQVWPSKADEAVRLLIYLYWQAPSPPLKPSSLSASLKKNMLGFKDTGHRVGHEVKGQIHFESKFSSLCNLFLLPPRPFFGASIQLKLRLNWQQLSKRLAAWWTSGALGWHLSGPCLCSGVSVSTDSQDPLAQALPWVSPADRN